jgi:hypothetical protein
MMYSNKPSSSIASTSPPDEAMDESLEIMREDGFDKESIISEELEELLPQRDRWSRQIPFNRWQDLSTFFKDEDNRKALGKHFLDMQTEPGQFVNLVIEALLAVWLQHFLYLPPKR